MFDDILGPRRDIMKILTEDEYLNLPEHPLPEVGFIFATTDQKDYYRRNGTANVVEIIKVDRSVHDARITAKNIVVTIRG